MKLLELCLSSELNLTIKQKLLKLLSNEIKTRSLWLRNRAKSSKCVSM